MAIFWESIFKKLKIRTFSAASDLCWLRKRPSLKTLGKRLQVVPAMFQPIFSSLWRAALQ